VIPIFNGQDYLPDALASVAAQTVRELEIIVVDDGSTDQSARIARDFADKRIRCVRQENAGAAAARNRGVEAAEGKLLAFLDADDIWLPDKLERQASALQQGLGDLIFTRIVEFVSPDLDDAAAARLDPRVEPVDGFAPTGLLMRRRDFAAVGPFDPAIKVGEFIDWFGRAREAGLRAHVVPDVLARRRLHERNQGRSNQGERRQYAQLLKRMLDRRRTAERG